VGNDPEVVGRQASLPYAVAYVVIGATASEVEVFHPLSRP